MQHKGKRYSARKMLELSTEDLHDTLSGNFTLVFDDGEMEVSARSTIFSSYVWDLHRLYPNTPMKKKHHCAFITDKSVFGNRTHIKLISNVIWDVYEAYKNVIGGPDTNILSKKVYELSNHIYNDMVLRTEDSVVSLDITDFIEIMEFPTVKDVLDNVVGNQEYIENSYKVLREALRSTPELQHNSLAKAVRSGLVREGQALQCLGPRGYVTDVDSHFFKNPITRGFAKGLRYFHDSLTESRSSAKSLVSNKILLSGAEYFARRLQILCQVVQSLHQGDCGSQKYLRWKIRPREIDNHGKQLRPSDLETLEGKYYLHEESNTLRTIGSDDTYLYGKTLKIRSIIAGCAHPNPNGICSVCFGEMSLNVPKKTNLGHLCAATMTQQSNQNILSTKHYLDGAALTDPIRIPPEYKNYLGVTETGNAYTFKESLKGRENYIILAPHSVAGLVDLYNVENFEDLALFHVSDIYAFGLRSTGSRDDDVLEQTLIVGVERRRASFTIPFLHHIKKVGWSFDQKGNYIISLDGWDYNRPAMKLPSRQYNMSDHAKAISIAIESSQERLRAKDEMHSPEDELVEFSDLVNSKLNVNIALLEVILLGSLVQSTTENNFFVPKAGTKRQLSVASDTIANRSLSGMIAYDAMAQKLVNPSSLIHDGRPQLPMDVFIKPQETINDPYRYENYYYDN